MTKRNTFLGIKNECLNWHYLNRDNANEFFWRLREEGAVYSPTLSMAVLWCEWKSGDEIVDRTFEVVLDLTPDALCEHVEFIREWGGWNKWATDLLADFDHYSFSLDDENDVSMCVVTLAAICTISDWTSHPEEAICNE